MFNLLTFWREGIIVSLFLLLLLATNHIKTLDAEIVEQKTVNDLMMMNVKSIEIDYNKSIDMYQKALEIKPKEVIKLQKIYIREGKDDCETLNNLLDDYRNAI